MNCSVCHEPIKWFHQSERIEAIAADGKVWSLEAHAHCRPNAAPPAMGPQRIGAPELLEHMRPFLVNSLRNIAVDVARGQPIAREAWRTLEAAADLLDDSNQAPPAAAAAGRRSP